MKLHERLAQHTTNPITPEEAGRMAETLRFRCRMNYAAIAAFVAKHSGMNAEEWESLLYEAEEGGDE